MQDPFRPPSYDNGAKSLTQLSSWRIAIPYLLALLMCLTVLTQAGWYGYGFTGLVLSWLRIMAFVAGYVVTCYVLFRGTNWQRASMSVAVLGYTSLLFAALWNVFVP